MSDAAHVSRANALSSKLPRQMIEQELKLQQASAKERHVYTSLHDQANIVNAIRSRAKLAVLEQKRELLADDNTFFLLAKHFSDANMTTMNFKMFKEQGQAAPHSLKRFFTAGNFMLFPRNAEACINCDDFLR